MVPQTIANACATVADIKAAIKNKFGAAEGIMMTFKTFKNMSAFVNNINSDTAQVGNGALWTGITIAHMNSKYFYILWASYDSDAQLYLTKCYNDHWSSRII